MKNIHIVLWGDFMEIDEERIIREMSEDFGDGDLILMIGCRKCDANFELSKESVALALMMNTSLIEYIKYVQHSTCPKCREKQSDET